MNKHLTGWLKRAAVGTAAAVIAGVLQVPATALADTAPVTAGTPVTASVDPLPTVQIDGVAWTQLIIGNTVYVGGSFTTARPAGSAAGVNTTVRSNLLAYDLTTGTLITAWAPSANAEVRSLVASPDNSRIYVGGSFTSINGQVRNRIAALDPTTGALIAGFQPKADATVQAIAATPTSVYFGGLFTTVNAVTRSRIAAASAVDGTLLPWAPNAQGGRVRALAVSPDGTKVLAGGSFTTMNGSASPGYGLAALDPVSGINLPWAANNLVRNGGENSGITSIKSDGTDVYVSGYTFGEGGNLEGISRMRWIDGSVVWVEDCHGDTYESFPVGDLVYGVGHAHYCGNVPGGFPQTSPNWTFHFGTAFSKSVAGTLKADPLGYFNWVGNPAPAYLNWYPLMTTGTYTGQSQAGWTVTGNSSYVVYGGEFPTVGGTAQQGLVRFAVPALAPNKVGPVLTGAKTNPTVTSTFAGGATVSWPANWDRDNEALTYSVIRNGVTTKPAWTTTAASTEWNRPTLSFTDSGLVPGSTVKYRIFTKDPFGNEVRSETVTVVVASTGNPPPADSYGNAVYAGNPSLYWRLADAAGSGSAADTSINQVGGTYSGGVTLGGTSGVSAGGDSSAAFDGATGGLSSTVAVTAPQTFTTQAWFRTTTTRGGKILGFGSSGTGSSSIADRHVYMSNSGQLLFGVRNGMTYSVIYSAAAYNDGKWHQVSATLGNAGMVLYVDGAAVASRSTVTSAASYSGYWRVGGDNLSLWTGRPRSDWFAGSIDEVTVYPRALSAADVAALAAAGGGPH